jgi:hypothetical protein
MMDCDLLTIKSSPGLWVFENNTDQRVYVCGASNVFNSCTNMIKKLMVREHRLPPLLIQDYKAGKLVFKILEYTTKDRFVQEVVKGQWMKTYRDRGYYIYNSRDISRYFVHIEPVEHLSLDGKSKRILVHVRLIRKQNRYGSLLVGVFKTIKEAKEWAKWGYGEYDKYSVDKVVVAVNNLTKLALTNPLISDPNLVHTYRKIGLIS